MIFVDHPSTAELVAEFAAENKWIASPASSQGQCWTISDRFARYLRGWGKRPVLVGLLGANHRSVPLNRCHRSWLQLPQTHISHFVVRAGRHHYDWTAKQFDFAAPFPLIQTLGDLKRGWQTVYDMTLYRGQQTISVHKFHKLPESESSPITLDDFGFVSPFS